MIPFFKVRFFVLLVMSSMAVPAFAQTSMADSLWQKFHHLPADSSRIDTIIQSVLKMRHKIKNSPDEERMLQSALSLALKLNYQRGMAECYNLLGVYYRDVSRYGEAISYHEKAFKIGEQTRDSVTLAYALNSMGVAYRRLDENQKAFQYHFQALGIAKATGDTRNTSIAMNSIANIHLSMGDYKSAITEFEECLQLEKKMGRNIGQAINYSNLGSAWEGLGDLDKAIAYYHESLRMNALEKSDKGMAICYNLLGEAHLKKGEYDKALSFLRQAVSYNGKLHDRINVANNYISIGKAFGKKGNPRQALTELEQGLKIATEINSPSLIIDAYKEIASVQSALGETKKAYDALYRAYEYRDTLYRDQAAPEMAKMRTLYELDKKEDQIKLLKQENQINRLRLDNRRYLIIGALVILVLFVIATLFYLHYRKQKNHKLKLKYELQSLRSQMNPHFIFNALNSIDNFIWKSRPQQASEYLVKFSNLMRMTLQNSRSGSIPLASEVEFLKLYLELENFRRNDKFTYEVTVSPDIDPLSTEVPSMVIQPFVENAILHGLSHKTDGTRTLSIRFSRKHDLIVCEVEDNGVGRKRAREFQENKFVKRQSLGIQVTEERVDLLKQITGIKDLHIQITDLESVSPHAPGTRVVIQLPSK